jgi:hypothetical protein
MHYELLNVLRVNHSTYDDPDIIINGEYREYNLSKLYQPVSYYNFLDYLSEHWIAIIKQYITPEMDENDDCIYNIDDYTYYNYIKHLNIFLTKYFNYLESDKNKKSSKPLIVFEKPLTYDIIFDIINTSTKNGEIIENTLHHVLKEGYKNELTDSLTEISGLDTVDASLKKLPTLLDGLDTHNYNFINNIIPKPFNIIVHKPLNSSRPEPPKISAPVPPIPLSTTMSLSVQSSSSPQLTLDKQKINGYESLSDYTPNYTEPFYMVGIQNTLFKTDLSQNYNEIKYNDDVINSLHNKNNVYLFTSNYINNYHYQSFERLLVNKYNTDIEKIKDSLPRYIMIELIKKLNDKNVAVSGVITKADARYTDLIPSKQYDSFYKFIEQEYVNKYYPNTYDMNEFDKLKNSTMKYNLLLEKEKNDNKDQYELFTMTRNYFLKRPDKTEPINFIFIDSNKSTLICVGLEALFSGNYGINFKIQLIYKDSNANINVDESQMLNTISDLLTKIEEIIGNDTTLRDTIYNCLTKINNINTLNLSFLTESDKNKLKSIIQKNTNKSDEIKRLKLLLEPIVTNQSVLDKQKRNLYTSSSDYSPNYNKPFYLVSIKNILFPEYRSSSIISYYPEVINILKNKENIYILSNNKNDDYIDKKGILNLYYLISNVYQSQTSLSENIGLQNRLSTLITFKIIENLNNDDIAINGVITPSDIKYNPKTPSIYYDKFYKIKEQLILNKFSDKTYPIPNGFDLNSRHFIDENKNIDEELTNTDKFYMFSMAKDYFIDNRQNKDKPIDFIFIDSDISELISIGLEALFSSDYETGFKIQLIFILKNKKGDKITTVDGDDKIILNTRDLLLDRLSEIHRISATDIKDKIKTYLTKLIQRTNLDISFLSEPEKIKLIALIKKIISETDYNTLNGLKQMLEDKQPAPVTVPATPAPATVPAAPAAAAPAPSAAPATPAPATVPAAPAPAAAPAAAAPAAAAPAPSAAPATVPATVPEAPATVPAALDPQAAPVTVPTALDSQAAPVTAPAAEPQATQAPAVRQTVQPLAPFSLNPSATPFKFNPKLKKPILGGGKYKTHKKINKKIKLTNIKNNY